MHDEPATPPAPGEPPGRPDRETGSSSGQWRQHAGFSLFFDSPTGGGGQRIRLYHEETGDETTVDENTVPGGALHDWVRWILERVGPVTELTDAGGADAGAVSVQLLSARIVAEPSLADDVEDLQVEARMLVSGLSQLRRGLRPAVVEIVFGAPRR